MKNISKLASLVPVLLFALISYGFTVDANVDHRPNHDLPAFNSEKAQTLIPDQRQRYDILMFNQLFVVGDGNTEKRYQLFRKMAEDGFEPAYLLLRLHGMSFHVLLNDQVALKRAKELGDQGDRSALCLWVLMHEDEKGRFDVDAVKPWLKKAAELKHPHCMGLYAGLAFFDGLFGDEVKTNAISLLTEAAKQGDLMAQLNLVNIYGLSQMDIRNWPLAKCWVEEALKSDTDEAKVRSILLHNQAMVELGVEGYVSLRRYKEGTYCTELDY